MRRPIQLLRLTILLLACVLLTLSMFPVTAQDNLLENPGFEDPYEEVDGTPPRTVAEGWTPWHISREDTQPSYENVQPEYDQTAPDTTRIREGDNAQNIFTSFFTFDGGVFQNVTEGIESGTEYRFSVYAYVWSSTLGDPEVSEIPGGVLVQAGIDPTGGTDATSDDIEWSSLAAFGQYDSYRQYAVRATSAGDNITVFVRITIDDAVPDTSVWLDEAVLEISTDGGETDGTAVPEATNTDVAEPTNTDVPAPTATDEPPPTVVVVVPSETSVPVATNTDAPAPTATTEPILTATLPGIDPTSTVEAVQTSTPLPSATPEPTSTITPFPTWTPTLVQPTATVEPPTATPEPPTATPEPPTATPELPTATLEPPTATPELPTATPEPPTFTPEPVDPTPTIEVVAPATFTAVPTLTPFVPTDAPLPTATPTVNTVLDGLPARVLHEIRRGETVQQIADLYGSTTDAIIAENGLRSDGLIIAGDTLSVPIAIPAAGTIIPNVTIPPPTATNTPIVTNTPVPPAETTYIVQAGDTLFSIAARFNTTVAAIVQRNGIVNPNLISVGQFLVIPGASANNPVPPQAGPTTYVVRPGDNLYRISLRFGVSMLEIAQANGIFNVNRIFAGQVLVIP